MHAWALVVVAGLALTLLRVGADGASDGGAGAGIAAVASEAALLSALRDPAVGLIVLDAAIKLHGQAWAGSPAARLARDVTIAGRLQAAADGSGAPAQQQQQPLVTLDLNFLRDKVALQPGVVLTLRDLLLRGSYVEWVPGLHFVTYAPGAVVRLLRTARALPACPPLACPGGSGASASSGGADGACQDLEWLRHMVQEHQLPPGYQPPRGLLGPGNDESLPFSNQLAAIDGPTCAQRWLDPSSCTAGGVEVTRLAYEVPRLPDQRFAHAFVGLDEAFSSLFPCEAFLAPSCIAARGYPACFKTSVGALVRRARWREQLAPAAAAGLAAACIVLSALWWSRQQQRQRRQQAALRRGSSALVARRAARQAAAAAAAGADTDASVDALCSSSKTPSPACSDEQLPAAGGAHSAVTDSAGSLLHLAAASPADEAAEAPAFDARAALAAGDDSCFDHLSLGVLIGAGSFGRVYAGDLCGERLALKVMEVSGGRDLRAAQQELAINKLLRHPNVVRCHAYRLRSMGAAAPTWSGVEGSSAAGGGSSSLRPVSTTGAAGSSGSDDGLGSGSPADHGLSRAWTQVQLLMEFCDRGSLHDAAVDGLLRRHAGGGAAPFPNMTSVLSIARDVARGMQHLHERGVCHGDLTSKNVLLCSCSSSNSSSSSDADAALCAKVADFGLSRLLPAGGTHLSTLTHGTLTHMAPELLISHRLRPAADAYSFGVLMYELVHLGSSVGAGGSGGSGSSGSSGGRAAGAAAPLGSSAGAGSGGSGGGRSSGSGGSGGGPSPGSGAAAEARPASPGPASPRAGAAAAAAGGGDDAGPPPQRSRVITRVYEELSQGECGRGGPASTYRLMQHVLAGGRPVWTAPGVPGPYKRLAQRCMATQPTQRPTFEELQHLLTAALSSGFADVRSADLVGSW